MAEGDRLTPERWRKIQEAAARPAASVDPGGLSDSLPEVTGETGLDQEDAFFRSVESRPTEPGATPVGTCDDGEGIEPSSLRRIGAYRIVRRLGTGGMGAVYLAVREEAYYAEVAIKLLKWNSDPDLLQRFRGERQILAGLEHPNIARLLDGGTAENGLPYLVMEYVDGKPIDRYCAEKDLSIVERIRLFQQVCSAVDYAHRSLVVHRDLKPSNILVTPEGVPKLLDFGIAKLLSPDASAGFHETRTGFTPLTPRYASPEQVRGERITVASDVYSLGVLLFELLTGHPPYELKDVSLSELLRLVCESTAPKPSENCERPAWKHRLAGDLDNVVLMALRKEPGRRYATAGALTRDLECYLQDKPVAATEDTLGYRLKKLVRRHRGVVLAAAAAVVCLLAGTVLALWQASVADRERAVAETRFQQVRQLAGSFLFEFEEAIQDLPGATPVRELVVERALRYLDSLARDAAGDAALRLELAVAYRKVGDIQGNPYLSNLGRPDEALKSYDKAKSILGQLPPNDQAQAQLAMVLDRMADVRAVQGDLDEALEIQDQAATIRERAVAAKPKDLERILDVAASTERLSELWNWKGDPSRAVNLQQIAGSLYDSALELDGTNPRARRGKAVHFLKMGDLVRPDDLAQAQDHYRSAIEIFETLAEEQPTNAPLRHDLSAALKKLAGAEMATDDSDQALEHFRRALSLTRNLARDDPRNSRSQRDLAVALASFGSLLDTIGRQEEALGYLTEANAIFERRAEDDQGSGPQRDLALIQSTLGEHFAALGAHAPGGRDLLRRARTWYERSRRVWLRLQERGILREADQANLASVNGALARLRDQAVSR